MKYKLFGKDEVDFVLFFNSRNIRRKQIPDTMWAFKMFLDSPSKLVICFLMIVGRLEIFPIAILFYKKTWKN